MAYGDIHNHNGTICRARKRLCPFGEDSHSSSMDEYVYHHADETGVDPSAIRRAIADGAKPAEAVELAKDGLLDEYQPVSTGPRRGGYIIGKNKFRFRREMTPQDLRQITREIATKIMARMETSRSMSPVHLQLADRYGGATGVPSVSYDPISEKYSTGTHRYWIYEPEFESKSLRAVVDRAAELHGYEDSECELVEDW